MNKEERMKLKLYLIVIGVVLFVILMISGIWTIVDKSEKTEGISNQQSVRLVKALYEEAGISLQDMESAEGDLTYGQYSQMFAPIDKTEGYILEKKEKERVSSEQFYNTYWRLVEYYQLGEKIQETTFCVLADDTTAESTQGEALYEGVLVTEEGLYQNRSEEENSLLYQNITGILRGEELLAVVKFNEEEFHVGNVWIMEAEENAIQCFLNHVQFRIPFSGDAGIKPEREQISELVFKNGKMTDLLVKKDKISGKILRSDANSIELEGAGKYDFTEDFKIYKLYGELREYTRKDLKIGYDFTDFVIENGKICAGLVTRDEKMEKIRVLVQTGDYKERCHEALELTADTSYTVTWNGNSEEHAGGETLVISKDSSYFSEADQIVITPGALTGRICLNNVHRSQGVPGYRGSLEIRKTEQGLAVINEVLLEEYLYAVVPSEMPASYPLEALKAQAVCARTYAYRNMEKAGLPEFGAHVDDSTTYQVYNNILENAETTKAVKETKGELLYAGEEPAGTYYYSTSCGYGTDANVWKGGDSAAMTYLVPKNIGTGEQVYTPEELKEEEKFNDFICGSEEKDYESGESYYRWSYRVESVEPELILKRLQTRYEVNPKLILTLEGENFVQKPVEELGDLKNLYVEKRGPGGIVDELVVEGSQHTFLVVTEHNVRYILNNTQAKVVRQDGTQADMQTLLPSAFLVIQTEREADRVNAYTLIGGGFGHGVGMSQNGARNMAKAGMDSSTILEFFYEGCQIRNAY